MRPVAPPPTFRHRPFWSLLLACLALIPFWTHPLPAAAHGATTSSSHASLQPKAAPHTPPTPPTPPGPSAPLQSTSEHWYTFIIDGVRSGYMHETITRADDRTTTSAITTFSMKRGPVELKVTTKSSFVETLDGKPIWASYEQRLGDAGTTTIAEFTDTNMRITRTQGTQAATETLPLPEGQWFTPAQAREYIAKRLEANPDEITVRILDLAMGTAPALVTRSGIQDDSVSLSGRTIPAKRATSTVSLLPGVESIEVFDLTGRLIKSTTEIAGMRMESMLSDQATALAPIKGGAEVMVRTLVTPSKPIENPRSLLDATYTLRLKSGTLPTLPATGAQSVTPIDARTARVTLRSDPLNPASEADTQSPAYLASTLMCSTSDPEIIALTKRATAKAGPSPADRAEAMRRFVHTYLNQKSLDVGYASASETARSRAGDCTEHAVLLAAMLRADGIPARGVSGLVYVDEFLGQSGVFGYHMWTQALLTVNGLPTWVDLDAAIDLDLSFDATHIATGFTTFADNEGFESMQNILPLMGSLSIDVE